MAEVLEQPDVDYDVEQELDRRRADGSMLRMKAKMLLEQEGLPRIFDILQKEETPASTILDTSRFLMRLADMEPKPNAPAMGGGPGFSITINIPSPVAQSSDPASSALNVTPAAPPPPTITMSLGAARRDPLAGGTEADEMPPLPPGWTNPFPLTPELTKVEA